MTVAALEIRSMQDDEVPAVIGLWEACGLTRPWNDPGRDIAFARQSTDADVLIGVCDGAIAASVMVGQDGHRGVAYYVAVAPTQRGRGFGRLMMDAAEAWCRARGLWKMNLLVRDDNIAALGFYDSLGYTHGNTTQLGKWIASEPEPSRP